MSAPVNERIASLTAVATLLTAAVGITPVADVTGAGDPVLTRRVEELIDSLQTVSAPRPGYSRIFRNRQFRPLCGTQPLGSTPAYPTALVELVELGLPALPQLLAHLADDRPTSLRFGPIRTAAELDFNRHVEAAHGSPFTPARYTSGRICVGDLCSFAVGRIVNRDYGVLWEGSGLRSPVHSPEVAHAIRQRWSRLTAATHRKSLVRDLLAADSHKRRVGAYECLTLFYPEHVAEALTRFFAKGFYQNEYALSGEVLRCDTAEQMSAAFSRLRKEHGPAEAHGVLRHIYRNQDDLLDGTKAAVLKQFLAAEYGPDDPFDSVEFVSKLDRSMLMEWLILDDRSDVDRLVWTLQEDDERSGSPGFYPASFLPRALLRQRYDLARQLMHEGGFMTGVITERFFAGQLGYARPLTEPPSPSEQRLLDIGLAVAEYRRAHGDWPPSAILDAEGNPIHSWRALVLPYTPSATRNREYDMKVAWHAQAPDVVYSGLYCAPPPPDCCAEWTNPAYRRPDKTHYLMLIDPTVTRREQGTSVVDIWSPLSAASVLIVQVRSFKFRWHEPHDLVLSGASSDHSSILKIEIDGSVQVHPGSGPDVLTLRDRANTLALVYDYVGEQPD